MAFLDAIEPVRWGGTGPSTFALLRRRGEPERTICCFGLLRHGACRSPGNVLSVLTRLRQAGQGACELESSRKMKKPMNHSMPENWPGVGRRAPVLPVRFSKTNGESPYRAERTLPRATIDSQFVHEALASAAVQNNSFQRHRVGNAGFFW